MIKGEATMKENISYVGLDVDDTRYHGTNGMDSPIYIGIRCARMV